ncbi:TolC family outer membrane protein [Paraburkholderia tagetis]|uniref:TolC family outer membrane protein n=1 Tax=Paraburkholderia tagetis TaxID=2913261 RepID=A0A9X1ZX79_9BURK|nr:TolC family outer membrane protein [Paraburkholderia tagetis]MCG5077612.1 TolC family outer membrane protein [Paraburkholderia tagetis]
MSNCSRHRQKTWGISRERNRKAERNWHAVCNAVKAITCFLVIAPVTTANASSLGSLASEALAADAAFRSAEAAWRAGIEKAPQGRAGLLPQVGIQQVIYRNGVRIPGQTIPGYSTNGFTLTLNQPLFNWAAWESWQQGQLLAMDADLALAQAKQDLLLRVAHAYLTALNAQDDLALALGHRKAVAEQLALAERRFALGDATIVDTNEALAGFDAARADEVAAQTQLDTSYAALQKIVGHPVDRVDGWRDDARWPPVEPATLEQWMDTAATADYGVRRKMIAIQLASRERSKARAGDYPTVGLVGNVSNGNAAFINGQTNFYTGASRGSSGYVGIQISLPLTDGLMTRSKVREALALEDKAREDLDDAQRSARLTAHDAYLGVTRGLAQTDALASAVRSATVALRSNQTGYRVGVRVNADVLDAGDKLYRAQRNLARARAETLAQALKLKASTADLGEADLAALDTILVENIPARTPTSGASEMH